MTTEIKTTKLPLKFEGIGEVKGFVFKQVKESEFGYVYEVENGDKPYYEVFKKKTAPICIDFTKRIYSETEFKEVYPNAKQWGITAWSVPSLASAFDLLKTFTKNNEATNKQTN